MLIAFVLTMPGKGSWNGKWTGEGNLYAIVKNIPKAMEPEKIAGKCYNYSGLTVGGPV